MVSYLKLTNEKVDLKASWLTSAQQHCTIDWTPTWFAAPWHTELNLTPDITRSSHCHSSRLSVIATQYPVEHPTSIGPHLPSRFDRSNTDILFSESSSSFEMRSEKNDFFFGWRNNFSTEYFSTARSYTFSFYRAFAIPRQHAAPGSRSAGALIHNRHL